MKTVYKYPLVITDQSSIETSVGAKPLHVGLDPSGMPCIWCEVDPKARWCENTVYIVGTGNKIPAQTEHFGSFVDGYVVWHVYLPAWQ